MVCDSLRVLGLGRHALADDDDGQQHELDERLTEPRNTRHRVTARERLESGGERDKRDKAEQVRRPHRADGVRNPDGERAVNPPDRPATVDDQMAVLAVDQAMPVDLLLAHPAHALSLRATSISRSSSRTRTFKEVSPRR